MGIDPGTAIIGFAIIKFHPLAAHESPEVIDWGCIKTKKESRPNRLCFIHKSVSSLVKQYLPDVLAVERVFFHKNIKTALAVGEAQGVIMLAGAQSNMQVVEYTPLEVKESLTGDGRSSKKDVQFMLQAIFSMDSPPTPDDAADALAIALCHISNVRLGLVDLPFN